MKDQYFGDFGDYQKISLLKNLQKEKLKVLVHWLKTKNDESTDGKHISYLEKPELWASFDPGIYTFLKEKINSGERLLSHIETSEYCSEVEFLKEYIESEDSRKNALQQVISSNADVVLFDPDNGIEVASTNKKNIHKYVTWDELQATFKSGKSVIVYQHFSRTNREKFIREKVSGIEKRIMCPVVSIQVRHSVYFFLIQQKHKVRLMKVIKEFSNTWKSLAVVR
jgi:hypothetical protein